MPVISVVMPVYNGEKYLREAVESVLKQSFSDFEFIIIDDGSMDKTEEIIKSYNDQRIVYIKNSENLGLAKSFNIGVRAAQGKFITRMDADDISVLGRFQEQLIFLKNHADVDLVGSSVILIKENGKILKKVRRPINHIDIKWSALFSVPVIHPTAMCRSEIFKNNLYDESFYNSEDYELFSRLLFTTQTRFANISRPLLFYRTSGFTPKLGGDKRANSARNAIKNIEHYLQLSSHEKDILILLRQYKDLPLRDLWTILKIYIKAAKSFCQKEKIEFPKHIFIYFKLLSLSLFLVKHKIKVNYFWAVTT